MSEIPYTLIRSKRKTLALVIDGDGALIARAPRRMSEAAVQAFIRQKAAWIAAKQREVLDSSEKHCAITLRDGERILLFGEPHLIRRADVRAVFMEDARLLVPFDMELPAFADWMKAQARAYIPARVELYAGLMGLRYKSVKMSGAKRRWGSCGAADSLNFAWRLVMCPRFVIDYVVVHELCHIVHKNHGGAFWQLVATVLPDYREATRWLRANSRLLDVL